MELRIFTYIILFLTQTALCSKQYCHPHLKDKRTKVCIYTENQRTSSECGCMSLTPKTINLLLCFVEAIHNP